MMKNHREKNNMSKCKSHLLTPAETRNNCFVAYYREKCLLIASAGVLDVVFSASICFRCSYSLYDVRTRTKECVHGVSGHVIKLLYLRY